MPGAINISTSIVSTSSNLSCPVAYSEVPSAAEFTPPISDIDLTPRLEPNSFPLTASTNATPSEKTPWSPLPAIHTYCEALLITSLTKLVDPSAFLAFFAIDKYGKVSRTSPCVPEINPSWSTTIT